MEVQSFLPKVSVIIPARNSENVLGECLNSLMKSTYPIHEIIVVDDASTDETLSVAGAHPVKTITLGEQFGPNYCRNRGAAVASGDIFLFLDSDVVIQADTIQRIIGHFSQDRVDAVVGFYSARHRHPNLSSQYKNLWIRYSYLKCGPGIDWIFGAVAAIRQEAVWKVRGFDKRILSHQGGDDLELGKRLTNSNHTIRLVPGIEVEHLKQHTLLSLLKNDLARSQGFVQLAGNLGQVGTSLYKGFVNVYPGFVISTLVSWPILVSGVLGIWLHPLWWLTLVLAVSYVSLNIPFLRYFARYRGSVEAVNALGIMFMDHLVCALGSAKGYLGSLRFHRDTAVQVETLNSRRSNR